jgi:hypothetical protein
VGNFERQRVCVYRGLSFFDRPEGVIPRGRGLDGDYRVPPSLQGSEKVRGFARVKSCPDLSTKVSKSSRKRKKDYALVG